MLDEFNRMAKRSEHRTAALLHADAADSRGLRRRGCDLLKTKIDPVYPTELLRIMSPAWSFFMHD